MSNLVTSAGPSIQELARLHACVDPAESYTVLAGILREHFGVRLRGAYLASPRGDFRRDADFAGDPQLPEVLDPANAPEDLGVLHTYRYRGLPLGALVLESHGEGIEPLLEHHFAPAYFRTAYLSETLEENARAKDQVYYLVQMGSLLGHLDLDLLLVKILELTTDFLGADLASMTLYDADGELRTEVDWGLPHEGLMAQRLADGRRAVEVALESGEPLFATQRELTTGGDASYRAEKLLILPLRTSNQTVGSINLVAPATTEDFGPERLQVVGPGVGLAAVAVENALLVRIKLQREREQQQMAVAQTIQVSLLPQKAPAIDGLDLAASSVAAAMIGGDYYDYLPLSDGTVGLVVADVAGKGVPAGLIMTATRAMFRAACRATSEPGVLLGEVNRLLSGEQFGGRFVTAIVVRIEPENGSVRVASAGHGPLLIRRSDGRVEELTARGRPLGIFGNCEYEEQHGQLEPGDEFVMCTDGVTEAMDGNRGQFGDERLAQVISHQTSDTANDLLQRVLDAVADHIGTTPRSDDTTLVVGKWNP